MSEPVRPIWFAGDLDDPWVREIADALPAPTQRIDAPGPWSDLWLPSGPATSPRSLVLHRDLPTAADAQALARLRGRCDRDQLPWVVLYVGALARHAELERWTRLVDEILPEATAAVTAARHALSPAERPARPAGPRGRVAVVAQPHDLRQSLADTCRAGGYGADPVRDGTEAAPGVACVWEVPVLEPDWAERLAARSRTAPVVALLSFADRGWVRACRAAGAAAVLELTAEVEDLWDALDRVVPATIRVDPGHPTPPAPRTRDADRARIGENRTGLGTGVAQ